MAAWEKQRQWLEQERQRVLDRLEDSGDYGLDDPLRDELGELSTVDNHPADVASEVFERGKDIALRDLDQIRLQQVDRALQALAEGTYGTCQRCGQPIPVERLEANPVATFCVQCQRAAEAAEPFRDRPIEELFLYPGFGRTQTDGTESLAFDGEDAWQAVARHNQRQDSEFDYEGYGGADLDDNEGVLEAVERISNEEYRDQLP
ncbi:MAG: TraR/DksA C4-type zinc finger protein [Alicyclobacillus sp.]|nr:TraR/DksA C4-type zinc finger protein [Alicyclobacillus sp.]